MEILIKIKEDARHSKISSAIGVLKKGTIYAIDSSLFDDSVMDQVESVLTTENNDVNKEEDINEDVKEETLEDESKPEKKEFTREELFKLNKKEQIKILTDFGVEKISIPKLEKGRVDLILKLQN